MQEFAFICSLACNPLHARHSKHPQRRAKSYFILYDGPWSAAVQSEGAVLPLQVHAWTSVLVARIEYLAWNHSRRWLRSASNGGTPLSFTLLPGSCRSVRYSLGLRSAAKAVTQSYGKVWRLCSFAAAPISPAPPPLPIPVCSL